MRKLKNKLEECPKELEDLHDKMFSRMNPQHQLSAYKILLCVAKAQRVEDTLPTLLQISFLEQDHRTKYIIEQT